MKLRKCPFCGKEPVWGIDHNGSIGRFVLSHACHNDGERKAHTAFISVYGKTKEEVAKRWNGCYANEQ